MPTYIELVPDDCPEWTWCTGYQIDHGEECILAYLTVKQNDSIEQYNYTKHFCMECWLRYTKKIKGRFRVCK